MKKTACILILFSVICVNIFSQTGKKLSDNEKQVFEQRMIENSKTIKTLQCNFVQEKTSALVSEKAVSKGIMMFQSPSMLHWEYIAPTPSTLILNENNAALFNQNGKRMGNEQMLKQLGRLIISMVNSEGLKLNKQFSSEIFEEENNEVLIVLTPVQKRLKDFYSTIELKIDPKTLLANEIVLNEKSGDKTIISLTNKEVNKEIPSGKFKIK